MSSPTQSKTGTSTFRRLNPEELSEITPSETTQVHVIPAGDEIESDLIAVEQNRDAIENLGILPVEEFPSDILGPELRSLTPIFRVLLVDDNSFNRRVGALLIEKMGHEVATAGDGLSAIQQYNSVRFDLVLIDMEMPGIDGFETMARIRDIQESENRRVPLVALTSHSSTSQRDHALSCGMDDYLTKPLLEADLQRVFPRRKDHDSTETAPVSTVWGLDPVDIRASFPMTDHALSIVVSLFRESCVERLASIREAIGTTEPERVALNVHALRGSLSMFASPQTLEILTNLALEMKQGHCDQAKDSLDRLEHAIKGLQSTLDQLMNSQEIGD